MAQLASGMHFDSPPIAPLFNSPSAWATKRPAFLRRVGIPAEGTPSVALGAYEATLAELAAGYLAVADRGQYRELTFVRQVRGWDGTLRPEPKRLARTVMQPSTASVVQHLLKDVLNRGTGKGVRDLGFRADAAGKTGTDDDGWFIGFTDKLLCAVWVGYDDNSPLELSGAKSALPIWTRFMKRAAKLEAYQPGRLGNRPSSVVAVEIDPETGLRATEHCEKTRTEWYRAGLQPHTTCSCWQSKLDWIPDRPVALLGAPPGIASVVEQTPTGN